MKVRVTSDLPLMRNASSDVKAKELVSWSDNVQFACYEIMVEQGTSIVLKGSSGDSHNHVYYCCYGQAEAEIPGTCVNLVKDTVVALGGRMEMKVKATALTRLVVTYVMEDAPPSQPLVRTLEEVIGTERDIDWQRGRSRRFLLESDGFNMTLNNTICYPRHISPLTYLNNYELAYFVRGDVKYTWNDDRETHSFRQEKTEDGDGCVFLMDENDSHKLHAGDEECEALCVFYPALKGDESHDFITGKSSY